MIRVKVICIKECRALDNRKTCILNKIYHASIENDILYIYSDDNHHTYIGFFYSENFLTLADFREQRINSILND